MLTPGELAALWICCEGYGDERLRIFLDRIEAQKESSRAATAAPICDLTEREKWLMEAAYRKAFSMIQPAGNTFSERFSCWLGEPTGGGRTVESNLAQNAPK